MIIAVRSDNLAENQTGTLLKLKTQESKIMAEDEKESAFNYQNTQNSKLM